MRMKYLTEYGGRLFFVFFARHLQRSRCAGCGADVPTSHECPNRPTDTDDGYGRYL